MLAALYIEGLLVDEVLADYVWDLWDLWDQGRIDDDSAKQAWMSITDISTSS